jgi:hypothetical protein
MVSNRAPFLFIENAHYSLQKDRRRHAKAVRKGANLAYIQLAFAM